MSMTALTSANRIFRLALAGNPNSGKSTLFNFLTGLRQKVGNFPGVTVDKKEGSYQLKSGERIRILDFPGAYSFYPNAQDERVVVETLVQPDAEAYPDAVLYVVDFTRLEKHLLLFTQILDLGLPVGLVLNMADMAQAQGRSVDVHKLSRQFGVPVRVVSSHTGQGMEELDDLISELRQQAGVRQQTGNFYSLQAHEQQLAEALQASFPNHSAYQRLLIAHHSDWLPFLNESQRQAIQAAKELVGFRPLTQQVEETMARFDRFTPIVQQSLWQSPEQARSFTGRIDALLTHRWWGPLFFFALMFLIFQAIYSWASLPMDGIEWVFGELATNAKATLPAGWWTDLLTDGILAGLGGILVFVPQIAILFFLITLLEEAGYMARAAFMFDGLMRRFGLNGRSVVALISSGACAIPAIMSTRTIANWKERLLTILVAPFISCSARLPVYIVLIGFVVPDTTIAGIFNAQGLAFMGLYLLGIVAALGTAWLGKVWLQAGAPGYLLLELPEYRRPLLRNVGLTVWEKVRTFVVEAGQVILIISMILWALASYGPTQPMARAKTQALAQAKERGFNAEQTANLVASHRLEASYAGHLGKFIEPAIAPLGFDWKMGIAIISSFAAREVFVGTMATLYSVGSDSDEATVHDRLAAEVNPMTREKVYTPATALSLLIFYVFAMMCMSTLAVVKRETGSWKWPLLQFVFMTGLAYVSSLVVYQLLT
ncbi:MAG: ferrous iron transport protein B [Bacteroidetes bacterium]|nr:MAG: ferrous iron transport protein B [Bacteroidota bacterium]